MCLNQDATSRPARASPPHLGWVPPRRGSQAVGSQGRRGSVWAERYHARALRTPREVRNALVYVLQNWRKHLPDARGLDPRSSATWFDGWTRMAPTAVPCRPAIAPRTWLAAIGWRRLGLIDPEDAPALSRRTGRRPLPP